MDDQEYKKFEVIIILDGPNRQAGKELKKLIKEYPEMDVSYFVIEHSGVCAARNEATKHAKGDYLAYPSPDCWYYPGSLRIFANEFEDPKITRVWGLYDPVRNGEVMLPVGAAPIGSDREVWYPSFKYSNFADCSFPVKKEINVPFDVNCKSLNDWEHNVRMLKKDNFSGKGWKYIPEHFFACEAPVKGGLSDDSHQNWIERKRYIQEVNGITPGDLCVTSLGAPTHAFSVAEKLDAEYLPMPSFKSHNYKGVYLLGFYTREGGGAHVTQSHMDVFEKNKGKNIIHWIGTDILDLYWTCSFMKLKAIREWMEEKKVINLCECDYTQKELKEIGIDAKIVPIPPEKLYKPIPLPEKFTVGVYLPGAESYKPELIFEVIEGCPDIDFILFGNNATKGQKGDNWKDLGYIDYDELMPQVSCNLRIT